MGPARAQAELQALIDSGADVDAEKMEALPASAAPTETGLSKTWMLWFERSGAAGDVFLRINISGPDDLIEVWHEFDD